MVFLKVENLSLLHYVFKYSINVFIRQLVVHREADDLIGNFSCHWQVFGTGTWQASIGAKGANERIEIAAT